MLAAPGPPQMQAAHPAPLPAAVVAPKTLLAQWRKELQICGLGGATHEYGGSAGER